MRNNHIKKAAESFEIRPNFFNFVSIESLPNQGFRQTMRLIFEIEYHTQWGEQLVLLLERKIALQYTEKISGRAKSNTGADRRGSTTAIRSNATASQSAPNGTPTGCRCRH